MSEQFYDEDKSRQQEKVAATPDMVAQRRAMLELLDLKEGEHVLDVGSGNGIFAREILETVTDSGHVCGIDSAEPMVATLALSRRGCRYSDHACPCQTGRARYSQCCKTLSEERSAGNLHATFCGSRRRVTASGSHRT